MLYDRIKIYPLEALILNSLKSALSLIVLGNVLYLAYIFFADSSNGPFADFTSGLLLGLSIATNLVGIVLAAAHCKKSDRENKQK